MNPVEVIRGDSPVVLGMPHTGTYLPDYIWNCLNERGQGLSDTDWHIHDLYSGLLPGATIVRATFHRYVIDANRDPSGVSLYPGQNTTGLVPLTDFDGLDIWNTPPDEAEIARRRDTFHAPYHAAIEAEMARIRDLHGTAILYDCHSIKSEIPYLFADKLPYFNIGTNEGKTCSALITNAVENVCHAADTFSTVTNGRFKGGWTTRHYGRPQQGWHAIQMELAQCTYMQESPPWAYLPERADILRPHLAKLLNDIEQLALKGEIE